MTKSEKLIMSRLLSIASEKFSNHGCNDVPDEVFEGVPKEEIKALRKEYSNRIDSDIDDMYFSDYGLMDFFSWKLQQTASNVSKQMGLLGEEITKRQQLERKVKRMEKEKSDLIEYLAKHASVPESVKFQDNAGAIMMKITAMAYDSVLSHIKVENLKSNDKRRIIQEETKG